MKNRVNLYHASIQPKLQLLTLSSVIVIWLVATLLCSFLYFYMVSEQQKLQSEVTLLEGNKRQQKTLLNELKNAVENLKIDLSLVGKVEEKQKLIGLKQRVLNELAGQEDLKAVGFSKLMLDLASHSQGELWLTRINLNGNSVVIEGAATDSSTVPKWLGLLGKTDYFRGQEFSDTRLYRDSEQQLNFVISTGEKLTIRKGTNND
jgi:Tfp pilus assembly protein PilN